MHGDRPGHADYLMAGSSELNRERWIATAVIVLAGIVWITSSHYPSQRIWGFNALAFLPTVARASLGIALATALMIVWSVPLHPSSEPKPGRTGVNPLAPAMIVVWMMMAILLRAATPLLGDGILRGDEIGRTTTVSFGVAEFLPGWLASTIQQNMNPQGTLPGITILAGLSSVAGVLFAVGLVLLWPRALGTERQAQTRNAPDRFLSMIWILTPGSSVIFFGYVESYGLPLAFLSLFALAILAHRNGRLGWGWPVVFWTAAAWSHLAALGWVPALLYAMYERRQRNQEFVLPSTATVASVAATLAVMFWFVPSSPTTVWSGLFLPIIGGAYSMLSPRHIVDLVNHAILILPASFFLIRNPQKAKGRTLPWTPFLLWGPAVVALITFNPKLGFWRDWDLFALLSAPAVVVLAITLAQRERGWPFPRRVAALTVALISLALWTWANHTTEASLGRFESLLVLDPDRSLTGYENLGRYYSDWGQWGQTVRVLGTALAAKGHARLHTQRGIAFSALNMPDSGLAEFANAIKADSSKADGYFGYGQMLWLLNRPNEALPYLRRSVSMDTTNVQYHFQLGQVLSGIGDYTAALPHFAFAAQTAPEQPGCANAYAITLYSAGDADSAISVLHTLIDEHPSYTMAHSNLAYIQFQNGDVTEAETALDEYERLVPPANRVATAASLRQAIDSIQATAPSENE